MNIQVTTLTTDWAGEEGGGECGEVGGLVKSTPAIGVDGLS